MYITQKLLKENINYNPNTGEFIWIKKPSKGGIKIGQISGYIFTNKNSGKRYRVICIKKISYYAHRLAWLYVYGKLPDNEIDHIDGNGLNNKLSNLRDVTSFENQKNSRLRSHNTSGITGVCWDKRRSCWCARIVFDGVSKHIGYFNNIFDATCARKRAERLYGFHVNHGSDRPL